MCIRDRPQGGDVPGVCSHCAQALLVHQHRGQGSQREEGKAQDGREGPRGTWHTHIHTKLEAVWSYCNTGKQNDYLRFIGVPTPIQSSGLV